MLWTLMTPKAAVAPADSSTAATTSPVVVPGSAMAGSRPVLARRPPAEPPRDVVRRLAHRFDHLGDEARAVEELEEP